MNQIKLGNYTFEWRSKKKGKGKPHALIERKTINSLYLSSDVREKVYRPNVTQFMYI